MTTASLAARSRERGVAVAGGRAFSTVIQTTGATVLRVPEAPGSPMVNRIVGLGVDRPATEADLDEALAAVGHGGAFYVALEASARPGALPDWLRARGLTPGWGWMSFARACEPLPALPCDSELELAEVTDRDERAAFARIVRLSYDLPAAVEPRLARAPDRGWQCWLAVDDGAPIGAAALYAADGAAYLGFAGTLPGHRGKGAQSTLLAARIRAAAELGCDVVVTETGERRDDLPSNSYRNILRAGFVETGVTANWRGGPVDA